MNEAPEHRAAHRGPHRIGRGTSRRPDTSSRYRRSLSPRCGQGKARKSPWHVNRAIGRNRGNQIARIARIGQAFGLNVIAHSQNLTQARAAKLGIRRVDRDGLFAESDVLSIHLKLSEHTFKVVGARQLALMKPGSILVNT